MLAYASLLLGWVGKVGGALILEMTLTSERPGLPRCAQLQQVQVRA